MPNKANYDHEYTMLATCLFLFSFILTVQPAVIIANLTVRKSVTFVHEHVFGTSLKELLCRHSWQDSLKSLHVQTSGCSCTVRYASIT